MRSTIVPAQVTTVEDRIVGNLGVTQVILLVMPLFLYYGVKLLVPPFGDTTSAKIILILSLSILSAISAIRIKGTLMIFRVTAIIRYCFRPRYYLFDKHSSYTRTRYTGPEALIEDEQTIVTAPVREKLQLSTAQVAKLEQLLHDPAAKFSFNLTKGGLRVRLTEIKEEG